jgi:glycosyltransferase involved in cell wall biosynthesis
MKIVQINTVCNRGSISKIMLNLYNVAESYGHTCYIAYGRGDAPSNIRSYKIGTLPDFIGHVARNFVLGDSGFGSYRRTLKFLSWLDQISPDIIHLHNIHGFYINIELLFDYIKSHNIKTLWTLHDCWSYTGQCAYYDFASCDKWITQCQNCPIYRTSYPYSLLKDNSYNNYLKKKDILCGVNDLTIITPSYWLANELKQSFLHNYPTYVIHNCTNKNIFRPLNFTKSELSSKLSNYKIDISKKIILGVANVWEERKGLKYFKQLAKVLSDDYLLILIGLTHHQIREISHNMPNSIIPIKHTSNAYELCLFYNIADVFVNPTLEDNFPTTNIEALSCGTPVITFDTGGAGECIDDDCGIVLKNKTCSALVEAIEYIVVNHYDPINISAKAPSSEEFNRLYTDLLFR